MALIWKVVESQVVDADWMEDALNTWSAEGWDFYTVQFAMKPNSRRPAMAFLVFSRAAHDEHAVAEQE